MHHETLESRRLFAITYALDAAGTLTVQGDAADDVITVQESGASLVVDQSPADLAWTPPPPTLVTLGGGATAWKIPPWQPANVFTISSVNRIVVRGGGGNDTIVVNASALPVDAGGEAGNDTVYGGYGDDAINGGPGADSLYGRGGHDRLDGGDGNTSAPDMNGSPDNVYGGDGDDTLFADDGLDYYTGGYGRDHLSYFDHALPVVVVAVGGRQWAVAWGVQRDEDTFDRGDVEDFTGTRFNDDLSGHGGPNTIFGGRGNDVLSGDWGNDILVGGDGDDALVGDQGEDILLGEAGNDRLSGYGGDPHLPLSVPDRDTLYAGPGNDTLDGGRDADNLFGEDGNDTFLASDGYRDTINGGAGTDTAVVDRQYLFWGGGVFVVPWDVLTDVEVWS